MYKFNKCKLIIINSVSKVFYYYPLFCSSTESKENGQMGSARDKRCIVAQTQMKIVFSMVERKKLNPFLKRILTCSEMCIFLRLKQWLGKDECIKYNGHRQYFDILLSKAFPFYQIIAYEILINFRSV